MASSVPFTSFGWNVFNIYRDQSISVDSQFTAGDHNDIVDFQANVSDLLADLAAAGDEEILSILWVRKLLVTFLLCLEEFRGLINSRRREVVGRALRESLLGDFLDRVVKALDFCNAAFDGIELLRQCGRHLETVLAALGGEDSGRRVALSERRVLRTKKAMSELAHIMFDEKDSHPFGRFQRLAGGSSSPGAGRGRQGGSYFRLSPSSWSAARQLQAMANNIVSPRSQDINSTAGLAVAVYTMNSVLFFVMWAIVAAFPCQDRGLHPHLAIPSTYIWSAPVMSLYDRIMEESKKKSTHGKSKGLIREIQQMEEALHRLSELTDAVQYPVTEEKEAEIKQILQEVAQVSGVLNDWLDPMESHVREVFRRISRCRIEGLDYLSCKQ